MVEGESVSPNYVDRVQESENFNWRGMHMSVVLIRIQIY